MITGPMIACGSGWPRGWSPIPPPAVEQAVPASSQAELSADQTKEEENEGQLPGAVPDPCCMGSDAEDMLDVLTGFIEEELENCRNYRMMAQQGPWQPGSACGIWQQRRQVTPGD